jgi:hypothetical protein
MCPNRKWDNIHGLGDRKWYVSVAALIREKVPPEIATFIMNIVRETNIRDARSFHMSLRGTIPTMLKRHEVEDPTLQIELCINNEVEKLMRIELLRCISYSFTGFIQYEDHEEETFCEEECIRDKIDIINKIYTFSEMKKQRIHISYKFFREIVDRYDTMETADLPDQEYADLPIFITSEMDVSIM